MNIDGNRKQDFIVIIRLLMAASVSEALKYPICFSFFEGRPY